MTLQMIQPQAGYLGLKLMFVKFCMLLTFISTTSEAADKEILNLTPQQCVALTQGQKCYVDVTLDWRAPVKDNYCLYSTQQTAPLFCWQQQSQGQYKQEFAADKNIVFTLKVRSSSETKAEQKLKVTWVHQKRGQPSLWWRIF